eukprot:TRINITY_DN753_c0_g3_i1.p1 TRINITY_DN753_c0_g3~~TRINITY_DN753_c0_g3_i1.p1  ORF type:complete len:109 (-),score=18.99 TRINITY_DN753_c0_g3_i1:85-411(-)
MIICIGGKCEKKGGERVHDIQFLYYALISCGFSCVVFVISTMLISAIHDRIQRYLQVENDEKWQQRGLTWVMDDEHNELRLQPFTHDRSQSMVNLVVQNTNNQPLLQA